MSEQNEYKDLEVFEKKNHNALSNEEGIFIDEECDFEFDEEYDSDDDKADDNESEESYDDFLPPSQLPVHPLAHNQHALEINISNRVQISSRADTSFVLIGHDGLSSPPSELAHLDHAILDGGAVSGARAQSRRITFDFVAPGLSYSALSRLFPLGRREEIVITRGNATRVIEGYRDGSVTVSAATALATPIVSVSFLCPSPYFRRSEAFELGLEDIEGGLHYPIEEGGGYPVTYGTLVGRGERELSNDGDYSTPFALTVIPDMSGVLEISLLSQTFDESSGESSFEAFSVSRIFDVFAGEEIIFDTGAKMLWMAGQKRISALEGPFPTIPVGGAKIVLGGVTGQSRIKYFEVFEGV